MVFGVVFLCRKKVVVSTQMSHFTIPQICVGSKFHLCSWLAGITDCKCCSQLLLPKLSNLGTSQKNTTVVSGISVNIRVPQKPFFRLFKQFKNYRHSASSSVFTC